jgi:hypothetical protein
VKIKKYLCLLNKQLNLLKMNTKNNVLQKLESLGPLLASLRTCSNRGDHEQFNEVFEQVGEKLSDVWTMVNAEPGEMFN